jgi:hemerythrin superfamily protein
MFKKAGMTISLTDTIKSAGGAIKATSSRKNGAAGEDMDILDKLHEEHQEVKELVGKLVKSESVSERKTLTRKIKAALVPHSRAEETVVYDAVIRLKKEKPKQDGAEGYFEHELADRMLGKLSKMQNAKSPEFSAAAKVLKELLEHHIDEEERNVWADVRANFSKDDRLAMNRKFEAAKKKVRVA